MPPETSQATTTAASANDGTGMPTSSDAIPTDPADESSEPQPEGETPDASSTDSPDASTQDGASSDPTPDASTPDAGSVCKTLGYACGGNAECCTNKCRKVVNTHVCVP